MSQMHLKSPLQFDGNGQTAQTGYNQHIRNLIEHLLFTSPGERVNRPTFGSGLLQMIFEPNDPEVAATMQFLMQGALNKWLGNLIEVKQVAISSMDARLEVKIAYVILKNQAPQTAVFSRSV